MAVKITAQEFYDQGFEWYQEVSWKNPILVDRLTRLRVYITGYLICSDGKKVGFINGYRCSLEHLFNVLTEEEQIQELFHLDDWR